MRITIAAIGRQKRSPEQVLVNDYLSRCGPLGRKHALGPVSVTEIDERKARTPEQQAHALLATMSAGAFCIAMDERGEAVSSAGFAKMLEELRDRGIPEVVFMIGGADGHDESLRKGANGTISFGPMVWPHMLARVMLAEQIYRAISIAAGLPYHRE